MSLKKVAYYNMPQGVDYEKQLLQEWGVEDIGLTEVPKLPGVSTEEALQDFDGLVTEYTILSEKTLKSLPRLKIIALQSVGYDEIDIKAARKWNIDVTNAPGYCAEDVATHAMAILLSLVRQIPMFDRATHDGMWNPFAGQKMTRMSGKKAGIVSFGNIPQKLTNMLHGFGIEIAAFDPGKSREFMAEFDVVKSDSLKELFENSDYIFLHTPLTRDTHHMINEQSIEWMKNGSFLINVSRGGLIDEQALIKALKTGKIAGAGLDVLEDEKTRSTELFDFTNVIITPHMAFLSEDSLKQGRKMALRQLVKKLSYGEKPDYIVNPQKKGGGPDDDRCSKGNCRDQTENAKLAQTAS